MSFHFFESCYSASWVPLCRSFPVDSKYEPSLRLREGCLVGGRPDSIRLQKENRVLGGFRISKVWKLLVFLPRSPNPTKKGEKRPSWYGLWLLPSKDGFRTTHSTPTHLPPPPVEDRRLWESLPSFSCRNIHFLRQRTELRLGMLYVMTERQVSHKTMFLVNVS